jgi:hypothetical protein
MNEVRKDPVPPLSSPMTCAEQLILFTSRRQRYQVATSPRRPTWEFWTEPTGRRFRRSCSSKLSSSSRKCPARSSRCSTFAPPFGRFPESKGLLGQASRRSRGRDHLPIVRPRASGSLRTRKWLDHLGGRTGHDPTACRGHQGGGRGSARRKTLIASLLSMCVASHAAFSIWRSPRGGHEPASGSGRRIRRLSSAFSWLSQPISRTYWPLLTCQE